MNWVSSQIRKHVLVGLAGAGALASAGCSKLPGEYTGQVELIANPGTTQMQTISKESGHASIKKGSGDAKFLIDVTAPSLDHCTLTVYFTEGRESFAANFAKDGDCTLKGGNGVFPQGGAGQGGLKKDGESTRLQFSLSAGAKLIAFNGTRDAR